MNTHQPDTHQSSTDPRRRIGQLIRVASRTHWSYGRWATIVAVVPSLERPCWMVEFSDGAPDVWPIYDSDNDYEFQEDTAVRWLARRPTKEVHGHHDV